MEQQQPALHVSTERSKCLMQNLAQTVQTLLLLKYLLLGAEPLFKITALHHHLPLPYSVSAYVKPLSISCLHPVVELWS